MDLAPYPATLSELSSWARQHGTTAEEARRRFVQFAILASVAMSAGLASRVAFKGGNALRFLHGNPRSTLDLDFSANGGFPDDSPEIQGLMAAALKQAERAHQVKARCQSIRRKPPGAGRTMPTYSIKVGYQLPGDRWYQNVDERLAAGRPFADVVEVEVSLNDVVCETREERLVPEAGSLRVCTLDDIIAEKLRALLQQVPRNRSRPQDVYDIASMARKHPGSIDLAKVATFLVRKSEARGIEATKSAFNREVKERAAATYEEQIRRTAADFIAFDEAWAEVGRLVVRLAIPG